MFMYAIKSFDSLRSLLWNPSRTDHINIILHNQVRHRWIILFPNKHYTYWTQFHSEELSDFKCDTTIGRHLSQISSLLDNPPSHVRGIIGKWKRLGTLVSQPRSRRPCKVTMQSPRGNKVTNVLLIPKAEEIQTSTGINVSTKPVQWEVSMAELLHANLTSPSHQTERCEAHCHWAVEQWKHHASLFGRQVSLGLVDAGRTLPAWLHCADCDVWWWRDNGLGLGFQQTKTFWTTLCFQLCEFEKVSCLFQSQNKVHKDMVGWVLVWKNLPGPHRAHQTPLGWTWMQIASQCLTLSMLHRRNEHKSPQKYFKILWKAF